MFYMSWNLRRDSLYRVIHYFIVSLILRMYLEGLRKIGNRTKKFTRPFEREAIITQHGASGTQQIFWWRTHKPFERWSEAALNESNAVVSNSLKRDLNNNLKKYFFCVNMYWKICSIAYWYYTHFPYILLINDIMTELPWIIKS